MATTATNKVAMNWIDGRWVDSEDHAESVNPATGEVIGTYAMGSAKDAQLAIDAAKRAFLTTGWRTTEPCALGSSSGWPNGSSNAEASWSTCWRSKTARRSRRASWK